MQKILAIVHLKGATILHYENLVKDISHAGKHLVQERLYHFASVKDSEILIADIWESAEAFYRYVDIMVPLAMDSGIVPKAEINNLYNEFA